MRDHRQTMATSGRRRAALVALVTGVLWLTGCGSPSSPETPLGPLPSGGSPSPGATGPSAPPPSVTPSPTPTPMSCVERTLAGMSLDERVGQLFMVGFDSGGSPAGALAVVEHEHVGSVTMIGRNYGGTAAVRRLTDRLQDAADLPLLVATDQEGGEVQVLHGPGFPEMPSALEQGSMPVAELQEQARSWGRALVKAGVDVDLAPVLDVVPASLGSANQPIGRYDRQFGSTAPAVASHGLAVVEGLEAAGVIPVVKHFPGLGSVIGNPDVASSVADSTTTNHSASLLPFRTAVDSGIKVVMVSSARYQRIDDEHVAMFSSDVVTDLLRHDMGFTGVVVTDDVGNAAAVRAVAPVSTRAVRFLLAGGDLVLTVRSQDIPVMSEAVIDRARAHPSFTALVDAAATRVLTLKDDAGLLPCSH